MACDVVPLPGGANAIVYYSGSRRSCKCKRHATRLCDWKMPRKCSGTCDAPLCSSCTTSPATDKDLCPEHAAEWTARKAAPPATLFSDQVELPL